MKDEFSFGQRVVLFLLSLIGPTLIRLYGATWHVKWEGREKLEEAQKTSAKVLFCIWHSRLLGLCYTHRYWNIGIMVSKSFDGEWIARIVTHLGYRVFRGSSTKDGAVALIKMLRDGETGHISLTVDGPRGPAEKVKPGALTLAARGSLPIVPISYVAQKAWRLKSWDRFILPKPFTTVTVRYGDQIIIPPKPSEDEMKRLILQVEEGINRIS